MALGLNEAVVNCNTATIIEAIKTVGFDWKAVLGASLEKIGDESPGNQLEVFTEKFNTSGDLAWTTKLDTTVLDCKEAVLEALIAARRITDDESKAIAEVIAADREALSHHVRGFTRSVPPDGIAAGFGGGASVSLGEPDYVSLAATRQRSAGSRPASALTSLSTDVDFTQGSVGGFAVSAAATGGASATPFAAAGGAGGGSPKAAAAPLPSPPPGATPGRTS